MANLSQIKREKMLQFLETLKKQHSDDESLIAINQIEKELTSKKYGLVWEEHEENVDVMMKTHVPVFAEDRSKEIVYNGQNGTFNFLLEGDNLHSLNLLEKTNKGKVDIIYIDPPYNTGAKDWKYGNDYVDINDGYRHSKWISMMKNRLVISKKLLSKRGVLVCAIDDNEVHSLSLLLEEIFGDAYEYHCITVVHNPNGAQGKNFSYCHEYAIFVLPKGDKIVGLENREDTPDIRPLRDVSGNSNLRTDAKNCFYPILVKDGDIIGFGDVSPDNYHPANINVIRDDGIMEIYPIDTNGIEKKWVFARQTVESIKDDLKIEWNKNREAYDVIRHKKHFTYKTVWTKKEYNANIFGTKLLKKILPNCDFDFPKSLYNVKECIGCILAAKDAIILDFFAGSGTTGQAVLELNNEDGGYRKFILCTNNENGICEDVTYQRLRTLITGMRPDGSQYSEGLPANLKYYRTEFIAKDREDMPDKLMHHIVEMIQLQYSVNISNEKYVIINNDDEMDAFEHSYTDEQKIKAVFIGQDVLLSTSQERILKNINTFIIPEYYFDSELREAGEIW